MSMHDYISRDACLEAKFRRHYLLIRQNHKKWILNSLSNIENKFFWNSNLSLSVEIVMEEVESMSSSEIDGMLLMFV